MIVIEAPGELTEKPIPGETEASTETVIETALEIVDVIQNAVEDAEDNGKIEVLARLSAVEAGIGSILSAIAALGELVITPEPEEIEEPETVVILPEETESPPVVIETENIEEVEVPPIQEEVPVAITPQIKQKKSTRWI